MDLSRDKAREYIILLGGRVTTGLSGKTTHLVAGKEPGESKLATAKKLGIKIFNENEFMGLLEKYDFTEIINTRIGTASEEFYGGVKGSVVSCTRLVEKYRPMRKEELVGNKGVINQLEEFLQGKTKFNSALISGPPGVGKTSAAHLLSRLNGYETIEFNASSLRNKNNLREQVSNFIGSKIVSNKRRVLIMDEVDGMSSDRGGIGELISIIKMSKYPIICISNDQNHPKIRGLASHCLNLRFRKPDSGSIAKRIKDVLLKEGLEVSVNVLNQLIHKCSGDIRYMLNTVSLYNLKVNNIYEKNITKGVFDVTREIFQKRNVTEKINLYFGDYSMVPLFVHENYIKAKNRSGKRHDVEIVQNAADSMSYADVVDSLIHGPRQEWSLMPYHGLYSCVIPTNDIALYSQINFPLYLGNISKANKNNRIFNNIGTRSQIGKKDIIAYAGRLLDRMFIRELENGNVSECIELLKSYDLNKEDFIELNGIFANDFKNISVKLKTQLTKEAKKIGRNEKTFKEDNEIDEEK